jgi:aspartyl-tRNA(Asn)/glutamyl-tRNA(Gln) amidotransferase subunit A
MRARVLVRREILDALAGCDALLSPTNLNPPGRIDAARETVGSAVDMQNKVLLRRISTYPFSMANVPAIAVPAGQSARGLPISLQIAAKPFDESCALRVAYAYEQATPWHQRHPDLTAIEADAKRLTRSNQ